jgi:hypothetical protein
VGLNEWIVPSSQEGQELQIGDEDYEKSIFRCSLELANKKLPRDNYGGENAICYEFLDH